MIDLNLPPGTKTCSESVKDASNLDDQSLLGAVAETVFGWIGVHKTADGRMVGAPPDYFITVPEEVPDVLSDSEAMEWMLEEINQHGLHEKYLLALNVSANEEAVSPRQQAEAAFLVMRENA